MHFVLTQMMSMADAMEAPTENVRWKKASAEFQQNLLICIHREFR